LPNQSAKAEAFRTLHRPGKPLILYNVWDAGSARAVAEAGAKALATGSASVAAANGFEDGEAVPLELALANASRIVAATDLPVSLDFERGYGEDADAVGAAVAAALETGIIGCNIEDSVREGGALRAVDEQSERLAAARAAAARAGVPLFINARTDVFFQKPGEQHDEAMVEEALRRGRAYAEAGADGLFVPLLGKEELIRRLVEESPLPVNIMALGSVPALARLAELGVARISFGPGPYRLAMRAVEKAARQAFEEAARQS
jgi:2-methylisocitrate lyase-like PEP mutase family enzyme